MKKQTQKQAHKTATSPWGMQRTATGNYMYRDFSIVYCKTKWGNVWNITPKTKAAQDLLTYSGEGSDTLKEAKQLIDDIYTCTAIHNS